MSHDRVRESFSTTTTGPDDNNPIRDVLGGLSIENDAPHPRVPNAPMHKTPVNKPSGDIDDVLTFILLSVAVSGSDFKSDCYKWWSKATRLAFALDLNREDERCSGPMTPCASPLCLCRKDLGDDSLHTIEQREERRRVFWLLFFEYFLPLMAILGDILEVHHRRRHPRLGEIDDSHSVAIIQELLSNYELSLESLSTNGLMNESPMPAPPLAHAPPRFSFSRSPFSSTAPYSPRDPSRERLAKAYSTHILHVLHVLLHGKWDAISMLDDGDDWILSKRFNECASHAISASQSVSTILTLDPELTFMSYLFGIYLLQGSFILLLFADRMPQLGPNESVAQACEVIIRAHEVCVVTLSTEFQKNFRKVLRSTLYSVQGAGTTNWDEYRSRRRALSLYRWTKGAKGLGL
ncbi:Xylanolytic transcriptional activator xlnR [Escovopsis weberi]|uniref:Xylanolytic transcriptional activator xlnR n=1 Tax=Escovopsis weberi TaxID=150374 RepID=A0A0M8MRX4_ESCWE|nr:Xylanolytic transcriptional activator xlnR [Escovopsis weberi]